MSTCPSCFEALYAPDPCAHRRRYLAVLDFVISQGVKVYPVEHNWWAWRAARSQKYGHDRIIEISSVAYSIYGWDVMTSILIHEFGHCDLFTSGICEGDSSDERYEIEKIANRRGAELLQPSLVPESYVRHREFFLRSYTEQDWTEKKCLVEWQEYKDSL